MIIYKATNKINNKCYIGQTIQSLEKRMYGHFYAAFKQNSQKHFYRALRKYGKDIFSWDVIFEGITIDDLNIAEVFYIELYNSLSPNGYNMDTGGNNATQCAESRKRISEAMMGNKKGNHPCSEETKKKISMANKNYKPTLEHRQKISNAHKGKKQSEKTKEKRRQKMLGRKTPWQTGIPQTPERIAKRVAKNTGKKRTSEFCQQMSDIRKGHLSPLKGRKRSQEDKDKMKEGWAKAKSKKLDNNLNN